MVFKPSCGSMRAWTTEARSGTTTAHAPISGLGTDRARLQLQPGRRKRANHVYLTATVDAAVWGAELAVGEGPGRIYIVDPTGPIEDDPNLTDKKFPGNPTKS
jgi:hypothetical protein